MKNSLKIFALFTFLLAHSQVQAQRFYVRERLVVPRYIHPPRQNPKSIWVESEWVWRNGVYVHVPGFWQVPPRPRTIWVNGFWKAGRQGYRWIPGHWR